jgi:uncharacterized membrane protein
MNVKHENKANDDVQKVRLAGVDPETWERATHQELRIIGWILASIVIFAVLFVVLGALTGPLTFIISPLATFFLVWGAVRHQKQTNNERN